MHRYAGYYYPINSDDAATRSDTMAKMTAQEKAVRAEQRKKPRAADVTRWIAAANAPAPSMYDVHTRRAWRKDRDAALDMLASWNLDANGNPRTTKDEAR